MVVTSKTCATDILRAVFNPLDGLTCGERRHHSTNIARIDGHLVAKTTTNIRRDNADTMLRQTSDNSKERTMCMRRLRSEPHSQFTSRFFVISNAATRLDRSRVDTRNKHILLDNDATGFRLSEIRIAFSPLACLPMINLVRGLFIFLIRSQQGGVRIKSLFWINDHWQRFIFDIDSCRTICRGITAGGNDESNLLHLKVNAIQREHCLRVP